MLLCSSATSVFKIYHLSSKINTININYGKKIVSVEMVNLQLQTIFEIKNFLKRQKAHVFQNTNKPYNIFTLHSETVLKHPEP